jgi:outer membrane receptor protein involved in Fe transport
MNKTSRIVARRAALTLAVAAATQAQGQSNAGGAWDEVVVTARNRQEVAQDIPLPIQVLGGVELQREDITTLWDLPFKSPNLQLNNPGETRARYVRIAAACRVGKGKDKSKRVLAHRRFRRRNE